jgi:hypothetical protein
MIEKEIQRAILDYLAARHILAFRQNTGAVASEYKGKKRFMRFGTPGMADVYCLVKLPCECGRLCTTIVYIEVKNEKGKQSELQRFFEQDVTREGAKYIVARSVEDVERSLKNLGFT